MTSDSSTPGAKPMASVPPAVQAIASEPSLLLAVFNCLGAGMYVVDAAGALVHLNSGAEQILGWSDEDLRGRSVHELIHDPVSEGCTDVSAECRLLAALQAGDVISGRIRFFHRDGSAIQVMYTSARFARAGGAGGTVVSFSDVDTEERLAAAGVEVEVLREERRRLAELERIKSQFLNLVAHELRTPLAVASGYTSMIAGGAFGIIEPPEIRRPVAVIEAKLAEIGSLVNQMLETARLESGRLHLHPRPVALRQLVHDALRLMTPLARDHQIIVVWGPGDDMVVADPERIATILTNLLDNACKYSAPGTDVEVRTGRSGDDVLVSVQDRGVGIDAADLPTLFTQFGRIVTRENAHVQGSGLGLYLCRDLARMHGGELTASSQLGVGSVFTLVLPAQPEAKSSTQHDGSGTANSP